MSLYDEIFKSEPVPFHWKNGGVFTTEQHMQRVAAGDSDDEVDDDDDELDVEPARGIFQHWEQVEKHRAEPQPSSIKLGSIVVVKEGAKNMQALKMQKKPRATAIGFRLGQVLRVHKATNAVDIQYFHTSSKMLTTQTTFRPQVIVSGVGGEGVAHSKVRGEDCFLTFHSLTTLGRIRSGHVRCILYILKCHAVKQGVDQGSDELQPDKFRVNNVQGYMEDVMYVRPVSRLGGSMRKKKRTQVKAESGNVSEHDDDQREVHSSDEDHSGAEADGDDSDGDQDQGDASDEEEETLTKSFFRNACKGKEKCLCSFEAMLKPGMTYAAVLGVYNHNVLREYKTEGRHWTAAKRGTEWDRLMALTVQTKRRRSGRGRTY